MPKTIEDIRANDAALVDMYLNDEKLSDADKAAYQELIDDQREEHKAEIRRSRKDSPEFVPVRDIGGAALSEAHRNDPRVYHSGSWRAGDN